MQVWPSHKSNLILMERYHFFSSSCSQFGVNSASLAQLYRDESETEGTLATTLKTLRAIHHEYFNGKVYFFKQLSLFFVAVKRLR